MPKIDIKLEEGYRDIIPRIYNELIKTIPLLPYERSLSEQIRRILTIVEVCLGNKNCREALVIAYISYVLKKAKVRPETVLAALGIRVRPQGQQTGQQLSPPSDDDVENMPLLEIDIMKKEEFDKLTELCPEIRIFYEKNEIRVPWKCMDNEEVKKIVHEVQKRMWKRWQEQNMKILGIELK